MAKLRAGLLFLGLVGLPFMTGRTLACVCGSGSGEKTMREIAASYSEGRNSSKIVFEGLIEVQDVKSGPIGPPVNAMSITMAGAHRVVSVRVLRAYRGQASGTVIILTGMGLGDCGFDFETGKRYLVYADRIDAVNLFTSICSGTSPIEHAGPALRFLRGEKPTADDLLDGQVYQEKVEARWYGTACGRVTNADGTPFSGGSVDMTQIRDEPLPSMVVSDPDLSKPDGSFCIPTIRPGKYLLTAEKLDYDFHIRWMGYYPGVGTHSAAVPIEIRAGVSLSDLHFSVAKEPVYTVRFRIVAEGSPAPSENLGVAIDGADQDKLAYHLRQNENKDGIFSAGYVPPGHYLVQTYLQPDFQTGKIPPELSKLRMAKQEVDISSDSEILLKLNPATQP
jgi:hypothetical protein